MKSLATAVSFALVAVSFVAKAEAGSCHGTPTKKPAPVQEPTPAVPAAHVGVEVEVDTPTPADVTTSVLVNGESVPAGRPSAAAADPSGGVGVAAAFRNANREARAAKRAALQSARSSRFAAKASEAAAEAAVNDRVRRAYE